METFAKLYYGYMDALISSMQTSIASGSALAHARPSMDFNSLNQESEPWSMVIVFAGWQ